MNRRDFAVLMFAGALPNALHAQQPKKIARIGYLTAGTAAQVAPNRQAFRDSLRDLGYIEGKTITIDIRFGEGDVKTTARLAEELVRSKPDVIVAGGVSAVRLLKQATSTIPIVIGNMDADPVQLGIIASLARPGGNVTGMIGIQWELAGKRLEMLREIVPKAKRIAVLYDSRGAAGMAHFEGTQAAAKKLGIELQVLEVSQSEDIDRALQALRTGRAEAVSVIHIGLIGQHRARVVRLMAEARLPAIYSSTSFVAEGALIVYSPDTADQYRRAAVFVDKILKGAKPADLPVEQPTKFELAINMKTAKALGITFPPTILVRAERIIE